MKAHKITSPFVPKLSSSLGTRSARPFVASAITSSGPNLSLQVPMEPQETDIVWSTWYLVSGLTSLKLNNCNCTCTSFIRIWIKVNNPKQLLRTLVLRLSKSQLPKMPLVYHIQLKLVNLSLRLSITYVLHRHFCHTWRWQASNGSTYINVQFLYLPISNYVHYIQQLYMWTIGFANTKERKNNLNK